MPVTFATEFASLDAQSLTELAIAVTGSWVKDGHRFSITKEDLDDIVKNFDKRGNGEVVCDFEHASERPEVARGGPVLAAGWINSVEARAGDDGGTTLFANVDFTAEAKKFLKDKKYKYFSPAIDWGATDKKTGKSKGATLTSGALTNHPFLEELPAIQLSEKGGKVIDHLVVPVVDNAKIKVKIDSKHDKDELTETKAEGDGDHPSSHYLVVEDPKKSSTWHLRVKNKSGNNDHGLMGGAWAALHGGYRGNKYEGPGKSSALSKLKALYKSEGMDTPDEKKASEVEMKMTDAEFCSAILTQVAAMEAAGKGVELCKEIRELSEKEVKLSETAEKFAELTSLGLSLLDDIDKYGVVGDRGAQSALRAEAESRAKKIDSASDDDETEELADKANKGQDPADSPNRLKVPRFSMRKMRADDKVGKVGHHALVAPDGKLAGYVSHGDFMAHAKKMSGAGRSEGTLKASDQELQEAIREATGRPLTLTEVTTLIEKGVASSEITEKVEATESRSAARKLLMSSTVTDKGEFAPRKARELLADQKITMRDFVDFENAVEDVDKAVKAGKFLPVQRQSLIQLCLSDRLAFEQLVEKQQSWVNLTQTGVNGRGDEGGDNPDMELTQKVEAFQKEHKDVKYAEAMKKVLASDAGLKERYDKKHRVLM